MRKISANYCLLPDGTVGRMPVITFNDEGIIERIKIRGTDFREEPGLEYYNGLLIPGLIQDMRGFDAILKDEELKLLLDTMYVKGSVRYVCDNFFKEKTSLFSGKVVFDTSIVKNYEITLKPVWENIIAGMDEPEFSFLEAIGSYLDVMGKILPENARWGKIEEGTAPGLILVKGLDLSGMKLKNNTSLKILIK
ncbi:MAG: hypothetical protein GXO47_02555 [Chlorobi bacterium]|nr:hypothetical protein [Chlorobiota bacterium]